MNTIILEDRTIVPKDLFNSIIANLKQLRDANRPLFDRVVSFYKKNDESIRFNEGDVAILKPLKLIKESGRADAIAAKIVPLVVIVGMYELNEPVNENKKFPVSKKMQVSTKAPLSTNLGSVIPAKFVKAVTAHSV
jgi:hypothetical protein